jgi:hypothetical protein
VREREERDVIVFGEDRGVKVGKGRKFKVVGGKGRAMDLGKMIFCVIQ